MAGMPRYWKLDPLELTYARVLADAVAGSISEAYHLLFSKNFVSKRSAFLARLLRSRSRDHTAGMAIEATMISAARALIRNASEEITAGFRATRKVLLLCANEGPLLEAAPVTLRMRNGRVALAHSESNYSNID